MRKIVQDDQEKRKERNQLMNRSERIERMSLK